MKKRSKRYLWFPLIVMIPFLSLGCSPSPQANSPDYDQIKQMVKDIMQTEDGRKAIEETLKKEEIKKQLLLSSDEMKTIIQDTVLSPKGSENFKKMMEDPKFASQLAKSLQKENEKLHKDLMKDPEYQRMLIDVMKDPEFQKNTLDLMKSSAYRQQMMTVMKESLQSPIFQEELMKLLIKAQEEAMKPKKKGDGGGGEKQEGGQDGGGMGGG